MNNTSSMPEHNNYGIPQGSLLGPLLFLLYIIDLPVLLQTTPRLFPDDTALLIVQSSHSQLESLAESELKSISKWMLSNSLALHPNKTVALNVSPSRKPSSLELTLDSVMIKTPEVAKYLGILIDEKLIFKSHIAHLELKLSRSVGTIARLRYYLPLNSLITLYYALIQSQMLYGLPIWASPHQTYLIKLRKLQNIAAKILAKAHPRERAGPWYYQSQILKLDDLYKFEIAKLMYQYTHNKLSRCFCNYFANFSDSHHYSTQNYPKHYLQLSRFLTSKTQKSLKFVGAKIWNKYLLRP